MVGGRKEERGSNLASEKPIGEERRVKKMILGTKSPHDFSQKGFFRNSVPHVDKAGAGRGRCCSRCCGNPEVYLFNGDPPITIEIRASSVRAPSRYVCHSSLKRAEKKGRVFPPGGLMQISVCR